MRERKCDKCNGIIPNKYPFIKCSKSEWEDRQWTSQIDGTTKTFTEWEDRQWTSQIDEINKTFKVQKLTSIGALCINCWRKITQNKKEVKK